MGATACSSFFLESQQIQSSFLSETNAEH